VAQAAGLREPALGHSLPGSDGGVWFTDPLVRLPVGLPPAPALGDCARGAPRADRPHGVVAFDVDAHRVLTNRRLLTQPRPRLSPTESRSTWRGRVYVSSPPGVLVLAPASALLGQIDVPGAVNFTFGGPDQDDPFITTTPPVWVAALDMKGARLPMPR
jgi:hypothetical protein